MEWANNRSREGYVEERLDRFFASSEWMYSHPTAVVIHIQKQSSDHCLLILDTNTGKEKVAKRFYFDKRYLELPEFDQLVSQTWNKRHTGAPMFQIGQRIKECRIELLKLKGAHSLNSGKVIRETKQQMDAMHSAGGQRDWRVWNQLKHKLAEAYRREETYWHQKSRLQWLQDGDQNTKFFHAYTMQRRRKNSIEMLINAQGVVCTTSNQLEEEVTSSYKSLFTSSNTVLGLRNLQIFSSPSPAQ